MNPHRVLVTGSSGFIGRWVVGELKRHGHFVIGLDKYKPIAPLEIDDFIICDICDRSALLGAIKRSSPDAVIHLAARTDLNESKRLEAYAANIDGVRNLIDAIAQTPTVQRAIYSSSQLVCQVGYVPVSVDDYCPNTLYGKSKVLTETITRSADGGGVTWCLVRPTTVWGPHMSAHYQSLLRYITRGQYFHCGNSPLYKSYVYAGNIAYQYRRLLVADASLVHRQTFYLADYDPLSLREYTNALARELEAKPIPTLPLIAAKALAKAGDILNVCGLVRFPFNSFRLNNILTEYVFDLSATQEVCGPLPFTREEGIRETARWFRSLGANLPGAI